MINVIAVIAVIAVRQTLKTLWKYSSEYILLCRLLRRGKIKLPHTHVMA